MITEAQRRALFALREALHLLDTAGMTVAVEGNFGVFSAVVDFGANTLPCTIPGIRHFLAEHPET